MTLGIAGDSGSYDAPVTLSAKGTRLNRRGLETRTLLEELLSYPDVPRQWRTLDLEASTAPFLPIEFRRGELGLRYFTTLTTLGTPHDITLQELRIESFFPADEATEAISRTLARA